MARVNIDNVETEDEFWKLLPLVGMDRDSALGKLVRFFRLAQKHYGRGEVISREELETAGLGCMIESGWARPSGDGFMAPNPQKHFAWYVQRVDAGRKGGLSRGNARAADPDPDPSPDPNEAGDSGRLAAGKRDEPDAKPLTLSLPPSPSSEALSANAQVPPVADRLKPFPIVSEPLEPFRGAADELVSRISQQEQEHWRIRHPDDGWLRERLAWYVSYIRKRLKPIDDLEGYVANLLNQDWKLLLKQRPPPRRRKSGEGGGRASPAKIDLTEMVRCRWPDGTVVQMTRGEHERWSRESHRGQQPPPPIIVLQAVPNAERQG